jgi:hypothetical protein
MIRDDNELAAIQQRIAGLLYLLSQLRLKTTPERLARSASEPRTEIEELQREALDYLTRTADSIALPPAPRPSPRWDPLHAFVLALLHVFAAIAGAVAASACIVRFFQVGNQRTRALLERHGPYLSAPFDQFRCVQSDEPSQCVDRGQTLVARGDSTSSPFLQVGQELAHVIGRHVGDGQAIKRLTGAPGDCRPLSTTSLVPAGG